jgi:hypothetical protein
MSHPHKTLRLIALLVAATLAAGCDSTSPIGPGYRFKTIVPPPSTATVGSTFGGGITLELVDANGKAVSNAIVEMTIVAGEGTVTPTVATTDGSGMVHADWTISQTAGENTLVARTASTDSTATLTVTGTPAAAVGAAVTPHTLRLASGTTTATVTGSVVDQFGNKISGSTTTYTSRNTGLVTVDATTGVVSVVPGASGTTYVVATGSNFKDSSYVIVLKSTDPACTGIATRATMAVGEVITTGFSDNGICVDGTAAGGDFAFVPFFNSSVPSAGTSFILTGFGIKTPSGPLGSVRPAGSGVVAIASPSMQSLSGERTAAAFHRRLLETNERRMADAAPNARQWWAGEQTERSAHRSMAVPAAGDRLKLNVNADDYCSNPNIHTGRVVAVTQRAIVIADTANPTGGFTDAEYAAYGATFDTLVYPLDVANFGEAADIDKNGGRTILFFTHAVNDEGIGTLGYFYGRDMLPKVGPLGSCPGSNVGEMVYLVVPDGSTPKSFVATLIVGTIAHELQHLINQSRRLYVNTTAAPTEERWLNEGLSHITEELMFYHVSGLVPRQNIGSAALAPTQASAAYQNYQFQNFARLRNYLALTESQGPIGVNDADDDFATRGATWSYLRFVADHRFTLPESATWFKLVNSQVTGLQNLYEVVGTDARLLMRDWTLAILLDDLVTGVNPTYQDLSWNLRQSAQPFSPTTRTLTNNVASNVSLSAAGTAFARFGVVAGGEAYVTASGIGGFALPKNVLLALVRTK